MVVAKLAFLAAWAIFSQADVRREDWVARELHTAKEHWNDEDATGEHQRFQSITSSDESNIYYIYTDTCAKVRVVHLELSEHGEATVKEDAHLVMPWSAGTNWKMSYSIGVDEDGFIHVAGDMDEYAFFEDRHAHLALEMRPPSHTALLWRSKWAGDVSVFEFQGNTTSDYAPPGFGFRRFTFINDAAGRLYAYFGVIIRLDEPGEGEGEWGQRGPRGLGMARFDTSERKWVGIGGPFGTGPRAGFALVATIQKSPVQYYPEYYAQMSFDANDVLHLTMQMTEELLDDIEPTVIGYACSDDHGTTWRRRSGGLIYDLPMRLHSEGQGLIDVAWRGNSGMGRQIATTTLPNGAVLIFFSHSMTEKFQLTRSIAPNGAWSLDNSQWFPTPVTENGVYQNFVYIDNEGISTMVSRSGFYRFVGLGQGEVVLHPFPAYSQLRVDPQYLRRHGKILALNMNVDRFPRGNLQVVMFEKRTIGDDEL